MKHGFLIVAKKHMQIQMLCWPMYVNSMGIQTRDLVAVSTKQIKQENTSKETITKVQIFAVI